MNFYDYDEEETKTATEQNTINLQYYQFSMEIAYIGRVASPCVG